MKVLHTIASLHPETGGPARSVPGLASALADLGMKVHLWSPALPEGIETPPGVVLHTGDFNQLIGRLGTIDLIHDHGLWLPVNHQVALASRAKGIPRMVSPRGMLEPWALNHKKWKKRLAWHLYQHRDLNRACALHATADSEAEQFRRLGLGNPVHIIPNGVDLPPLSSLSHQLSVLRPQATDHRPPTTDHRQLPSALCSLPSASLRSALFLGRIHPKKGLPLLVEAWAKVRPPGWSMQVIGPDEGGHRAEVEGLVRNAGLGDVWHFGGSLEGEMKSRAFQEASLFILPTFSENFGISVAEALASGVPVITTTGAPWQGLESHRCGWWVAPEVEALAAGLREATALNDDERQAMGERGARWMKDEFTWAGVASQMRVAYEQVLQTS